MFFTFEHIHGRRHEKEKIGHRRPWRKGGGHGGGRTQRPMETVVVQVEKRKRKGLRGRPWMREKTEANGDRDRAS
ncbi:protein-export membrane protein SecD [Sesbania bispinosa]|nr:protein-export membrane protein SecD [Sesbania bispinosa]